MSLSTVDTERPETFMSNPYPLGFEKVALKPGKIGRWAVEQFEAVDGIRLKLANLRAIRNGERHRLIPPGMYTRLTYNGNVIMSDTPAEAWEHRYARLMARDHVLINGLGLGFYLKAVLAKDEVTKVTVVEKSAAVLKLVSPQITDPRLTYIRADATVWRPKKGTRFGFVWHDIWADANDDTRASRTLLKRAYSRLTKAQGCWADEYME